MPSAEAWVLGVGFPPSHFWKNRLATRSPTATRVTPSPIASTTPQPSENGVNGSGVLRP